MDDLLAAIGLAVVVALFCWDHWQMRSRVRICGDGNCLFRALAYPHGSHKVVRECVVQHVEKHLDYYNGFLEDGQLKEMRKDGVWGDEVCLAAFADCTGIPVYVHDSANFGLVSAYETKKKNSLPPRYLLFDGKHYDVYA
jgi:hypothetical protein